jgi:hypothetical protein
LVASLEFWVLLWLAAPTLANTLVSTLTSEDAIGVALGSLLVSGAIGFVLGNVHHTVLSRWTWYGFDFRELVQDCVSSGRLRVLDASNNPVAPPFSQAEAWIILNAVWHGGMDRPPFSTGEGRAESLSDFVHSAGSLAVGALLVPILVWLVVLLNGTYEMCPPFDWLRSILVILVALGSLVLVWFGYFGLRDTCQGFIAGVFIAGLQAQWRVTGLAR